MTMPVCDSTAILTFTITCTHKYCQESFSYAVQKFFLSLARARRHHEVPKPKLSTPILRPGTFIEHPSMVPVRFLTSRHTVGATKLRFHPFEGLRFESTIVTGQFPASHLPGLTVFDRYD